MSHKPISVRKSRADGCWYVGIRNYGLEFFLTWKQAMAYADQVAYGRVGFRER